MLDIIGSTMKIAAWVIGDHYLAKWLSAIRFWLDTMADERIRSRVMADYMNLQMQWDSVNRKPKPPSVKP